MKRAREVEGYRKGYIYIYEIINMTIIFKFKTGSTGGSMCLIGTLIDAELPIAKAKIWNHL